MEQASEKAGRVGCLVYNCIQKAEGAGGGKRVGVWLFRRGEAE